MADEILIGTEGWRHAAWRGSFYPEELPADWEFCYYSNRLRAVWLPAEAFAQATAADIAEWLRDSDPGFRFVLGVAGSSAGEAASIPALAVCAAPLLPRTAGIALTDFAGVAAPELAARIAALQKAAPVCIDVGEATNFASNVAELREVTRVWDVDREPTPPWREQRLGRGTLCIARMAGGEPRAIRHALDQLAAAPTATAGLFFSPSAAAANYAEQARTLAELLGI